MKVNDLIAKLNDVPLDSELILMDYRMNGHHASSDGTVEGIYSKFDVEDIQLVKMDGEEEGEKYLVTSLTFENHWDYNENCDKHDKVDFLDMKKDFYTKLLKKLELMKKGELGIAEYIEEVSNKIKKAE